MRSQFLPLVLSAWMGGVLIASPNASPAQTTPEWEGGMFFSYLTGDYGQEQRTDIFYGALMIKRYLEWGDLTATIPYLDVTAPGVTFIGGDVEAVEDGGGGSGLGDIILKGRYYAVEQDGPLPYIDFVASVKLPTADADKGLGTGEVDATLLGEFTWRLGEGPWIALAELGYTFVGEPQGFTVENRWLYSLGMGYELNRSLMLSGYLDGRTAIFEGTEDPVSILLVSQYKYRPDVRLDVLLEFGLTDGAPDFGITLGLRKRI